MPFLSYWFWPNPAGWHYQDRTVMILLGFSLFCIISSFFISYFRSKFQNQVTRHLTASWASAFFWFGITALVLIVSRVETIQFLSMRAAWVLWFSVLVLYVVFQFFQFRRRHYTVLERTHVIDERDKYLPRKKDR